MVLITSIMLENYHENLLKSQHLKCADSLLVIIHFNFGIIRIVRQADFGILKPHPCATFCMTIKFVRHRPS